MALVPPASSREEEGSEGRLHNFGNLCKVLGHAQRQRQRRVYFACRLAITRAASY